MTTGKPETQLNLDFNDEPGSKIAAVLGLFIKGEAMSRFEAKALLLKKIIACQPCAAYTSIENIHK